jgi:hypothetical protein
MLLLLLACVTTSSATERFSGTLEPHWWPTQPGFGEEATDKMFVGPVLRLDTPKDGLEYVMYSSGDAEKLTMTADAAACLGGRVVVEAVFVPGDSAWSGGTLTGARILSCTPAATWLPTYGETATLTGTLRRWWWFLAPGYGAEPATDAVRYGIVLLVDGRPVPLFSGSDEPSFERHRRFGCACDGQEVTVTGRWEASKNPRAVPPYKLMDVTYQKPCANPSFFRSRSVPPKSAPSGWLE